MHCMNEWAEEAYQKFGVGGAEDDEGAQEVLPSACQALLGSWLGEGVTCGGRYPFSRIPTTAWGGRASRSSGCLLCTTLRQREGCY